MLAGGVGFEPTRHGLACLADYKSAGLNQAHPTPQLVEARGRAPLTTEFCGPSWHYAAPTNKNGDEGDYESNSLSSPLAF
jgi:hypothetical protein